MPADWLHVAPAQEPTSTRCVAPLMTATLNENRPWPRPTGPWVMSQTWELLLFAHWECDLKLLRKLVPAPLDLDLHHGHAWVGVTPFHLRDLRVRPFPVLPIASDFLEVNLRTYVTYKGKPGVYFFSLDAESELAVFAARLAVRLPYHAAEMQAEARDGTVRFRSMRDDGSETGIDLTYAASGPKAIPQPGSLDHFLTERYALYVVNDDAQVTRCEIDHEPWQLQAATADIRLNTLGVPHALPLMSDAPRLLYSERQETVFWMPERV